MHVVVGVEARVLSGIGLLIEGGLGVDDDSPDYVSAGLALRLN